MSVFELGDGKVVFGVCDNQWKVQVFKSVKKRKPKLVFSRTLLRWPAEKFPGEARMLGSYFVAVVKQWCVNSFEYEVTVVDTKNYGVEEFYCKRKPSVVLEDGYVHVSCPR